MLNPTPGAKGKIKVSRSGSEIGEFLLWEIVEKIKKGKLLSTDHYWQEGMTDWKLLTVSEVSALEKRQQEEAAAERIKWKQQKQKNDYTCHTCRESFGEYARVGTQWGLYCFLMLGALIALFNSVVLVFPIAVLLTIFCLIICVFLSGLTQPHCPYCNSTNISRPTKE